MKKIMLLFIVLLASMLFFSCTQDITGEMPANTNPRLMIYDTSDIISNKETRVQWYGNDQDGTSMTYYYCMTTDTTMTNAEAATELADTLWTRTANSYVDISMPFAKLNADIMFVDSTTYIDILEAIEVKREIVYSKFFLYGVDDKDGETGIVSKIFGRTNKVPKHPMVNSQKFGVNGFDQYWFTIGTDSAQMVLKRETSFWKPIDFRWMGEDPDGPEVDLEFKYQLCSIDTNLSGDFYDIDTLAESGWSISNLSVQFSSLLFDNMPEGKSEANFSFRVWVRDDALEESENHATVNFPVFAPQLNHGILYVDDTDDAKFNSVDYLQFTGNPDGVEVKAMYEEYLQDAGYHADYDVLYPDSSEMLLQDYDVVDFAPVPVDQLYQPSLKILSKYRLVIIGTEDRSQSSGISYASYKKQLIDYMNIGGKVMIIGHSAILLNDLYVNKYEDPVRDVFDNAALLNRDMCTFFYNYFGIYSYSTGESKSFFSQFLYDASHPLLPATYYKKDNYDFIGVTKYDHITDAGIVELKVDSAQVNKYWKNYPGPAGSIFEFSLKENGTVLTGIPVFEAYKGEIVLKYKSIYDLPTTDYNSDLTFEVDGTDTLFHDLKWRNPAATATTNLSGDVYRKSGAIATRYVSEGDVFRTAYIGFPLVFMDNSEGKVSDLFTFMINWFNLEDDPLQK